MRATECEIVYALHHIINSLCCNYYFLLILLQLEFHFKVSEFALLSFFLFRVVAVCVITLKNRT